MHSYSHNIKTFNNATMHLTRVERSVYRDLIEMYYDTEQPLPAVQFDALARRVRAITDEEIAALRYVLEEFFVKTGDVYSHDYCDQQIESYRAQISAKARAGRASAESRKKKAEQRRRQRANASSTEGNTCSTVVHNHKPITNNQEPSKKNKQKKTENYSPVFETAWSEYPKRAGGNPKRGAWQAWSARVKAGRTEDELIKGVLQYANFSAATHKTGTEYIMQAKTFFGPDEHFLENWETPNSTGINNGQRTESLAEKNYQDGARLGALAQYVNLKP